MIHNRIHLSFIWEYLPPEIKKALNTWPVTHVVFHPIDPVLEFVWLWEWAHVKEGDESYREISVAWYIEGNRVDTIEDYWEVRKGLFIRPYGHFPYSLNSTPICDSIQCGCEAWEPGFKLVKGYPEEIANLLVGVVHEFLDS